MAMNKNLSAGIPVPTLRRLPIYYELLKRMTHQAGDHVSGSQIAAELNLISIQVRKDLAYTGIVGKPKVGYEIDQLMQRIETCLGWKNISDAILIGVGNLGTALLGYAGFQARGLNIAVAFDTHPDKIGTTVQGKKIFSLAKLPDLVRRLNIRIGILTVPDEAAQATADLAIQSGIRALWNFASTKLLVPEGIIVQHENLASGLAVLSKQLEETLDR